MTAMSSPPFELWSGTPEHTGEEREPDRRPSGGDAQRDQRDLEPDEEGWRYGEFGPGWSEFTEALERFHRRPRS
jgi:hypothetical protein